MLRLLPLILALVPLPATAADFACRNSDAEIRCAEGACAIETQAFTPMEVRREGATLSICAYSGCWKGPIAMRRTRGGISFLQADANGMLSILHDAGARVAMVRWGGFANVMRCEASR